MLLFTMQQSVLHFDNRTRMRRTQAEKLAEGKRKNNYNYKENVRDLDVSFCKIPMVRHS